MVDVMVRLDDLVCIIFGTTESVYFGQLKKPSKFRGAI